MQTTLRPTPEKCKDVRAWVMPPCRCRPPRNSRGDVGQQPRSAPTPTSHTAAPGAGGSRVGIPVSCRIPSDTTHVTWPAVCSGPTMQLSPSLFPCERLRVTLLHSNSVSLVPDQRHHLKGTPSALAGPPKATEATAGCLTHARPSAPPAGALPTTCRELAYSGLASLSGCPNLTLQICDISCHLVTTCHSHHAPWRLQCQRGNHL